MNTKNLLYCAVFSLLFLFPSGCTDSERTSQSGLAEQFNVLFISVDDMNDWVGFLRGHTSMKIKTPNLDRLAESSLVFTNAYTASPACAPSRIAVLTGVHPSRSGIMHNIGGDRPVWRDSEALANVETLEQFFNNRDYTTLGGGKIYHSQAPPWTTSSQVEAENWDFYFPSPYLTHPHQIRPPDEVIYPEGVDNESRPGGMPGYWTWGPIDKDDEKMADYHVMEWASYELSRKHEKPFFLAAGSWKPHDPWEVPQKYFDLYPLEEVILPEAKENDLMDAFDHGRRAIHKWVLENDQWAKIIQAYSASITFADAMVGRLLDALEKSEYADNTIVVLWADHGMHMGEKENFEKFTLWEQSTRVPLILKVPGVTQPGSRYDQPVSLLDIYPTLAELTGFEPPSHLDGNSLIPQINNLEAPSNPVISSYRFTYGAFHLGSPSDSKIGHAVRSKHYRYIYYPDRGLEELYDHRTDPSELNNIAYRKKYAEVIDQHRTYLREMIPDLAWEKGDPEGYEIGEDGSVRKTDFIQMSDALGS